MERPNAVKSLELLGAFSRSATQASSNNDIFAAASVATNELIGHRLFTIMVFDEEAMEVERVYSSDVENYPAGGRKKKRATRWGAHVLEKGEPYIGHTADDIRDSFNDHAVILGLGLQSVLNMPVRHMGHTLGTMNLLHERNYYSDADLEAASLLAAFLAAPLSGIIQATDT